MNPLLSGILSALVATNAATEARLLLAQATGERPAAVRSADPVEQEYLAILELDDAAQAEVDQWILEADEAAEKGIPGPNLTLNSRIRQRLDPVEEAYRKFLRFHPNHARAHLAFGSFLGDIGKEKEGAEEWEKARELDPENPAAWNNLANYYGHRGPVKKAFDYYARAIELNPREPVYFHNYGTTVYLFRKDARQFFGLTEQEVFDKALALYEKARKLEPTNFPLATDIAQTYYGIKPFRFEPALKSWQEALAVARDEVERQGVYIHLARIHILDQRFDQARPWLDKVVHPMFTDLKERVESSLKSRRTKAGENLPAQ